MPKLTFTNEADIDLIGYFLDPTDAQIEINEFSQRFKRQRGAVNKPISAQNASIVMSELLRLYEEAKEAAMRDNVVDKHYLTGLRVTLGFPDSNKSQNVNLFFEPVYMKGKPGLPDTFFADIFSALPIDKPPYLYEEIPEKFSTPNLQDFVTSTGLYHSYMRVKRYQGNNLHYQPAPDLDWRGDTRSMVFSFQELFMLYHESYKNDDPNFNYGLQLSVISAAVLLKDPVISRGLKSRYRHTVVFSTLPLLVVAPYIKQQSLDEGDLANLAHLCPPATNCGEITYPT